MEKYSRWRDAGTGIQPFLPPVAPRTDSNLLVTLSNIIHSIVGPIQGLVKLVLISILTLVYFIVQGLGILLTPIPPLKRLWHGLFSTILLRSILFLSGFFYIKNETVSVRKSRNSQAEKSRVKSGDIVVTNWTSYIDVIYLAYKFNPVFTQVYIDSNKVRVISFWEAIRSVTRVPELKPETTNNVYDLQELVDKAKKNKWGPIVVFPEGTTTNGRALLKFAPIFNKGFSKDTQIHIMAFKYEYGSMAPTFTVGNQFFHYFKICSQFHNTLMVKTLAQGELALDAEESSETLCTFVGHISKLRKTNLTMSDKRDFLYYYQSRTKK